LPKPNATVWIQRTTIYDVVYAKFLKTSQYCNPTMEAQTLQIVKWL